MFRVVDAALVRVATHAGGVDLPAWPQATGGSGDVASWRAWLARVWSDPLVAAAVTLASPVLAAQVARVVEQGGGDPRRVRRLVLAVAKYRLRMTGRSTPFGLFAAVAAATFADRPAARLGRWHRPSLRADTGWLAAVVDRLESSPLVWRLPVVANDRAMVRGGRLVLPLQTPSEPAGDPAADPAGTAAGGVAGRYVLHDVDVRYTPAVAAVLRHADAPILLSTMVDRLAVGFPAADRAVVEAMLVTLVAQGLLLTGLRPASTVTDGLAQVVAQLRAVEAHTVAEVAGLVRQLYGIADALHDVSNQPAPTGVRPDYRGLVGRMRTVVPAVAQPVMVDLYADLDLRLPGRLREQVAGAAAVLTRLSPYPDGPPAWREYHLAFLERYGPGAVVPLPELVSDVGLGFPATYRGSLREAPAPGLSHRDRQLLAMAHTASMAGRDEITLDDHTLTALAGQTPPPAAPHLELFVQLHAEGHDSLLRGDYTLAVTGVGRAAGASTGRFLHLFDEPDLARFRAAYTDLPTARAGAQPVQLSCPPLGDRTGNVSRAPRLLDRIVSIGEHRPPAANLLRSGDLAVGADPAGLWLVSTADGRIVEPTAFNTVELRSYTQPLARFLGELARARAAVVVPFDWGTAAGSLPCLPRIRYRRTVLAAARWHLTAADLPGPGESWPRWRQALAGWRDTFRVPDRVVLVQRDQPLPLDLEQDLPLALLRAHLHRHGHARLDESPPAGAFGWLSGHAHEIVVPLAATTAPAPAVQMADGGLAPRGESHLPGASAWLYAKLPSHPDRHTELLTDLAGLLTGWDPPVWWWYVPYHDRDSGPHLRVRIRLPSLHHYGAGVRRLGAWAAKAHRQGLLGQLQLDTYHPETGRYGPDAAMAATERVFAADSTAALTQRRLATHTDVDPDAVAAASLVDLAIGLTGGTEAGMAWLATQLPREHAPLDRARYTAATRLANPAGDWAAIRSLPGGEALLAVWQLRHAALAAYRPALTAHRDPLQVLPSLLHLHHIRMFGSDPDRERAGRRLARAAAQRWLHTTTRATA